ncbi:MAG: hypothetical protein J7513_09305 [Solirubrobacteraceae bacterium]|nr:hypothetical protein [Solirubrobacteraceae bacterium]
MASPTVDLDLERTKDLAGRSWQPWIRRAALTAMLAVVAAGLAGVFGQVEHTSRAANTSAAAEVRVPQSLRGGLYWPAHIRIQARERIVAPVVVLGSGFIDGMQLNSLTPTPTSESTRDGHLVYAYPTLDAGDVLDVRLQLQVNPTTVGREDLSVRVEGDGLDPITIPRSVRVMP